MSNMPPKVRVELSCRKWYHRNLDPTFLFNLCTHHRPMLHRFGTMHISYGRTDGHRSLPWWLPMSSTLVIPVRYKLPQLLATVLRPFYFFHFFPTSYSLNVCRQWPLLQFRPTLLTPICWSIQWVKGTFPCRLLPHFTYKVRSLLLYLSGFYSDTLSCEFLPSPAPALIDRTNFPAAIYNANILNAALITIACSTR